MMITEYNFLWLHDAEEERFARELEHRRVVEERLDQQADTPSAVGRLVHRLRAHGRHRAEAHPARRMSAAGGTMEECRRA